MVIQRPLAGDVHQVIDCQTAEVVKESAVDLKQGPQRVGEGEDLVYPVAVGQTIKLRGKQRVGCFFAAVGAGVGDIFNMPAAGIIAAILLHAGVEERRPALICGEQFLSGRGLKADTMGQINSLRTPGG